eukprot:GSChrysophyteH2.ASY1.ANO1.597.1 assembled CDS
MPLGRVSVNVYGFARRWYCKGQINCFSDNLEKFLTTGIFKTHLPDVFPGKTHFKRAFRSLGTIRPDESMKNMRDRYRKYSAIKLDSLIKGLTVPLTHTLSAYRHIFLRAHPFEAAVGNLVVKARMKEGHADLSDLMVRIKALRAQTSRTGKLFAAKARKAPSAAEAMSILEEGILTLRNLYEGGDSSPAELLELQKSLRRIPVFELDTLTVVLVGAPNVGKSSLVRAVSSGVPEVNDYPFTTRSVTVVQVMDTPGLLDRPEGERNEMEKLTFASLTHLPTAVIFVIDASGLSGEHHSSLKAQLAIRTLLRERFPQRPWLDVVSKADMEIPAEALQSLPSGCLHVSTMNGGTNIDALKSEIHLLTSRLESFWYYRTHQKN